MSQPPRQLGRYRVVAERARGAMGLVFEGHDPLLNRRVAIKTLRMDHLGTDDAREYAARLQTEATAASRLVHPNIVGVYDAGTQDTIAYLVMEFIDGPDLRQVLDDSPLMSLPRTQALMRQLLGALHHAHAQGVIHRDVKPANILIDPSGQAKLGDFGAARLADRAPLAVGQGTVIGTPRYMSPEQVLGQVVDARADLFACGVLLYQLLAGVQPFAGASEYLTVQQILYADPIPLRRLNPTLPPALEDAVSRALSKDRASRHASAGAFLEALEAAWRGGDRRAPAAVGAPPMGERSASPTRRLGDAAGRAAPPADAAGTDPLLRAMEYEYWRDVKDSDHAEDLVEFLQRFGGGVYESLARRRLARLQPVPDGAGAASTGGGGRATTDDDDGETVSAASLPPRDAAESPRDAVAERPRDGVPSPAVIGSAAPDASSIGAGRRRRTPWVLVAGATAALGALLALRPSWREAVDSESTRPPPRVDATLSPASSAARAPIDPAAGFGDGATGAGALLQLPVAPAAVIEPTPERQRDPTPTAVPEPALDTTSAERSGPTARRPAAVQRSALERAAPAAASPLPPRVRREPTRPASAIVVRPDVRPDVPPLAPPVSRGPAAPRAEETPRPLPRLAPASPAFDARADAPPALAPVSAERDGPRDIEPARRDASLDPSSGAPKPSPAPAPLPAAVTAPPVRPASSTPTVAPAPTRAASAASAASAPSTAAADDAEPRPRRARPPVIPAW